MVAVPQEAYDYLGGIEAAPAACLTLSWLLGGANVTDLKRVETPKGVVEVDLHQVWGSTVSMREDIERTVGTPYSRGVIRGTLQRLESDGMIRDLGLVNGETRGKYGKRYQLAPDLLNEHQQHINVVKGYNLFYRGDPNEFNVGEIVTSKIVKTSGRGFQTREELTAEDLTGHTLSQWLESGQAEVEFRRNRYGNVEAWMAQVATNGADGGAYQSIGRWRSGEQGDPSAPVLMPWFWIDIDRVRLFDAYEDVCEILHRLENQGLDMERVYVSFSGRRGFHIQISADQFGNPIFVNARAASEVASSLMESICYNAKDKAGIERDPSVESPMNIVRVTGSTHERTGYRKMTWRATRFEILTPQEITAEMDQNYRGFTFPDPREGEMIDAQAARMLRMGETVGYRIRLQDQRRARGGGSVGDTIGALINGVAEGDLWHDAHAGRNKAGFILACWLVEEKTTGDAHIDAAYTQGGTELAMMTWNARNSPPMSRSEVMGRIYSAKRKIDRTS